MSFLYWICSSFVYCLQIHSIHFTFFLSLQQGQKSHRLHYILLAVQFLVDFEFPLPCPYTILDWLIILCCQSQHNIIAINTNLHIMFSFQFLITVSFHTPSDIGIEFCTCRLLHPITGALHYPYWFSYMMSL